MAQEKSLSIKQVWMVALKGLPQDIKTALSKVAWLAFTLACIQFLVTFGFGISKRTAGDDQLFIMENIISAMIGILYSIIYSIIIPYAYYSHQVPFKNQSLRHYLAKHMKLVTIETVRTLPIILLHFLLLIIPGFIKTARFLFVPFVVQLFRPYQAGNVDALQQSQKLTKGSLVGIMSFYFAGQILLLFILFGIPSLLQKILGFEGGSLQDSLIYLICTVPLGVPMELGVSIGLLKIFEKLVTLKEGPHELAF